jgi:hypothetical protein
LLRQQAHLGIKVPVVDGRFCIKQSQPRMKRTVRALFRPDIRLSAGQAR